VITSKLIGDIEKFVYKQGAPSIFHIDLARNKAVELARKLKGDEKVVELGALLMDCMIAKALALGKLPEHVKMSEDKVAALLVKSRLSDEEKANVLRCVREHHGVKKFYSLESEICCNADCYRFASVSGVIGGMINSPGIPLDELAKLYSLKADEKWNALSLGICKRELKDQYRIIKLFLGSYHKN